jgi:hypothetical protein
LCQPSSIGPERKSVRAPSQLGVIPTSPDTQSRAPEVPAKFAFENRFNPAWIDEMAAFLTDRPAGDGVATTP